MKQELDVNQLADFVVNNAMQAARLRYLCEVGAAEGNTKRTKLYSEFGYPKNLKFDHFYKAYDRMAPASAAVHRVLDQCWSDMPTVIDGDKSDEDKKITDWESKATSLIEKHYSKFKGADRRNLIASYSALILQVKDGKRWDSPVAALSLSKLREHGLVKLIPAWEKQLQVLEWQTDVSAEDYGEPIYYQFNESAVGNKNNASRNIKIHKSRVIILSEGAEDDDPNSGKSLLNAGYNKLLDLEKVSGGSAEGFLKNASRQLNINLNKEASLQEIEVQAKKQGYSGLVEAINDRISRLNSGTDTALVTQEGNTSVLSVTPADPKPTWEILANEFAASVQIPFTILFGQQTGRLASDEDKTDWAIRCNQRRNSFITPLLIEFLERMVQFGILERPKNAKITLTWPDLLAPSEKEKIANAKDLASVAESSVRAFGVSAVMPNEIRAVMEYEPLPESEVEPPEVGDKGDPLVDDKTKDKPKSDTAGE